MKKPTDEELVILPIIAMVVFTAAFGATIVFLARALYKFVVYLL